MKLKHLLFSVLMFIGVAASAQVEYMRITSKSYSTGQNIATFVLSYDTYERCDNNIKVINQKDTWLPINWVIKYRLRGSYTWYTFQKGWVRLKPYGEWYYDDAVFACPSWRAQVAEFKVETTPRL